MSLTSLDYLHDFVGICGFPLADLSLRDEILIFKSVMRCTTKKEELITPPDIHASFWLCEKQIRNIVSLFSLLPKKSRAFILYVLDQDNLESEKSKKASSSQQPSLSLFLWFLLEVVIETMWSNIKTFPLFNPPPPKEVIEAPFRRKEEKKMEEEEEQKINWEEMGDEWKRFPPFPGGARNKQETNGFQV